MGYHLNFLYSVGEPLFFNIVITLMKVGASCIFV